MLKFPKFVFYSLPLILYTIAAIFVGMDYPTPNYILGTWAVFVAALLALALKVALRPFKSSFMNLCDILCDVFFCLMWIPLLIQVHKKESNGACEGSGYLLDIFFPILACIWILACLVMLALYILRRKNRKALEYGIDSKSKCFI
jgi:hypothetical protein